MSVGSQQYAIGSTASIIATAPTEIGVTGPVGAVMLLPDPANTVYIGGSNVSATKGLTIATGTALIGPIPLFSGDVLYAVTASTATLGVLQT
jgi:hypothetical protein